ncbi:leucine-rich repeat extensin-like protein 2 [Salvelinus namaycush]|uniref:Leucine-rich repeat extensin-like protein 2 n=1 Tax=Salvelinus namaycush TaxID=8040 RepID=A0A8U0R1K4_SALNM|nr:leucine-rich repeat extensin-like protein 2 [Salvelinus namaycush]
MMMTMMMDQQEQSDDISVLSSLELLTEAAKEDDGHCQPQFRLQLIDDLTYEDVKKCYRGSTVSKYNSQYHKLFQSVPKEEILMKVYSCALLRDILLQGRLYISRNWLCFYANLFGKDIKVAIPVVSVRLVKKHRTAGLVPNGLAITVDTSQKYVFVSLLSRDSVYDVLRRICTHLQVNGKKSLSLKQYLEEPSLLSMDEFPVVNDFPPMLKWRRKPSIPSVSSSLPDLLGNSTSSRSAVDIPYLPTEVPLTLKGKIRANGVPTPPPFFLTEANGVPTPPPFFLTEANGVPTPPAFFLTEANGVPTPPPFFLTEANGVPTPPPFFLTEANGVPTPPPFFLTEANGVPTPPPFFLTEANGVPTPPPFFLTENGVPTPPPFFLIEANGVPTPPPFFLTEANGVPNPPPFFLTEANGVPTPPPFFLTEANGVPTPPPFFLTEANGVPTPPPFFLTEANGVPTPPPFFLAEANGVPTPPPFFLTEANGVPTPPPFFLTEANGV